MVRLPGKAGVDRNRRPEPLSGHEEDAFRRIAEALGVARADEEAPRTPPSTGGMPSPDAGHRLETAADAATARSAPGWRPIGTAANAEQEPVSIGATADQALLAAAEAAAAASVPPAQAGASADKAAADLKRVALDPKLLEHLPLPILVAQDDRPVFANKALLDLLGYADLQAVADVGGLAGFLHAGDDLGGETDTPSREPTIRQVDGSVLAVDARLQTVHWGGRPAVMLSLRERREEPPSPLAAVAESSRALAAAEARIDELETVLDTATDGVSSSTAGRIVVLNRSAEALFAVEFGGGGRPAGPSLLIAQESPIAPRSTISMA